MANIKLQSIPAFFADARADAHEKMGNRRIFFFVISIVHTSRHPKIIRKLLNNKYDRYKISFHYVIVMLK